MSRVVVPVVKAAKAGIALAAEVAGDTTNHHYYNNSGKTLLIVRNANVAGMDVTVDVTGTVDGQAATDRVVEVAAGATWVFGPYPVSDYGSQVNINVEHADIKLRAIEP
jgi:hypothetical protein